MSDEQKVLKALLNTGSLDNEEQKVQGIAQLAVDKGFDHLSNAQRGVIAPWLTRVCDGVTNPGGHHNNCHTLLEGESLASAIESEAYYGGVLCESCVDESEQYSREWDRIQAE
ncbi:hypothetical protein [Marinobacter adhaerens]|uniref:hypothetical protein n=1 Tax=Marinobacter adhaerens TaxID=1033846 RepID=UPI001E5818A3|nr:hypothetical protein [Marinobacter adhaerens]MCD1645754.1 hypothetical protein [Marinobacter adhaerens]